MRPMGPDVCAPAVVGAACAWSEQLLSRLRASAGRHAWRVQRDRLSARRAPGGGGGENGQGAAVRLPHVRSVRTELHRHVLPDELPKDAAQWTVRWGAGR